MAFDPITSAEINAGEPTRQELFTKIKDNEIDLDSRVTTVEGASNAFLPIDFGVRGQYSNFGTLDNCSGLYRITFNLTVTAVRLVIEVAGTSGSTEVDIKYKRGGGAWTSVLTTNASVAFGEGDEAISVDAVLNGTEKLLEAGDLLRCDLIASQTVGRGFVTLVEFEKT